MKTSMASLPPAIRLLIHDAFAESRPHLQQHRRFCSSCLAPLNTPAVGWPAAGRRFSSASTTYARRPGTSPSYRQQNEPVTLPLTQARRLATVNEGTPGFGPIEEYDDRVHSRRLREDEHQRGIVEHLQDLHDMLMHYEPHKIVKPTRESLEAPKKSFFGSIFGGGKQEKVKLDIPEGLPKGLYMYGDVGSGKTMLMDLFYDTLPPNITQKTRIHFHNFMQDVHKRLHKARMTLGNDFDVVPMIAADIAEKAHVLCFDEFQCTDVADAMILRRLLEALMSHGTVIVTTSNRHPDELYKNGIQRQSFIPCINLLKKRLRVLNLDSETDYRKLPRPPSGVYHHPLDKGAQSHADKWFRFLGDPAHDPPHPDVIHVWGREVQIPLASGDAARFTFEELIGRATGAADYIEMMRCYHAFIVTDVPGMTFRERDWARRFITFIDAVYESHAKLVLTSEVPLSQLFLSRDEIYESLATVQKKVEDDHHEVTEKDKKVAEHHADEDSDVDDVMRTLMDDLGMNMSMLRQSSMFSGEEERFAFARALSRLSEMGSQEWVERGMGMEKKGGMAEKDSWQRVRSRWREDSL